MYVPFFSVYVYMTSLTLTDHNKKDFHLLETYFINVIYYVINRCWMRTCWKLRIKQQVMDGDFRQVCGTE